MENEKNGSWPTPVVGKQWGRGACRYVMSLLQAREKMYCSRLNGLKFFYVNNDFTNILDNGLVLIPEYTIKPSKLLLPFPTHLMRVWIFCDVNNKNETEKEFRCERHIQI